MELSRRQALLGALATAVAAPAAPIAGRELARLICETQPMKEENPWATAMYGYSPFMAVHYVTIARLKEAYDKHTHHIPGVQGPTSPP